MVADAHRKFSSKAGGKGKKGNGEEAEAEPFSLLHKVCEASRHNAFWASLRVPEAVYK